MLGLYIRDERTKIRYHVTEVKKINGLFDSPCGAIVMVNQQVVVLKCSHRIENSRGYFRGKDGVKIPINRMPWLDQIEYSYPFFMQLLERKELKKIQF